MKTHVIRFTDEMVETTAYLKNSGRITIGDSIIVRGKKFSVDGKHQLLGISNSFLTIFEHDDATGISKAQMNKHMSFDKTNSMFIIMGNVTIKVILGNIITIDYINDSNDSQAIIGGTKKYVGSYGFIDFNNQSGKLIITIRYRLQKW